MILGDFLSDHGFSVFIAAVILIYCVGDAFSRDK